MFSSHQASNGSPTSAGSGSLSSRASRWSDLEERRGHAAAEDRRGRGDRVADADQPGDARPAVARPLPAVGVVAADRRAARRSPARRGRGRSTRPGRGWPGRRPRRRPGAAGPSAPRRRSAAPGRRRSGPARAGRPAPGSRRSRPCQASGLVIGPGSAPSCRRYWRSTYAMPHGPPTDAGARSASTLRPDRPEASTTRSASTGEPSTTMPRTRPAAEIDAVHVPLPDGQARHGVRRRPQGPFEGVAAGPVPGGDEAHARHVER